MPNISRTVATARAEGLNALGVDAITCTELEQLREALALTDGVDPGATSRFHIVAGLESHGGLFQPGSSKGYCDMAPNGRVNWRNLTANLAQLSLQHPQLIGYRVDDFTSGLAAAQATTTGVDRDSCDFNRSGTDPNQTVLSV